jgi:hypothetical protein
MSQFGLWPEKSTFSFRRHGQFCAKKVRFRIPAREVIFGDFKPKSTYLLFSFEPLGDGGDRGAGTVLESGDSLLDEYKSRHG